MSTVSPLSIHFFGPSKSSSRLERHNFSLPKTGCLSTGGGVSQVLHNPALRRSADWPGRGTKLVGHFPEALLVPFRSSARRSVSRKGFHFVLPFHKINLIYLGKDTRQDKTHSMLCFPLHGGLRPCYSSELEQEIVVRLSVSHFILWRITLFTPLLRLFTGHRLPLNALVLFRHFFLPSIKNFKGSHCSKKWLLYLGHQDTLIGKDSLSCILASPIFLNQALMRRGVFWLHRWTMQHFSVLKNKWVSSLNIGLCLAHLVLFDLGLKIVLFLEWTSHADFFFFNYPHSYHICWRDLFFPYSLSNNLLRWKNLYRVLSG